MTEPYVMARCAEILYSCAMSGNKFTSANWDDLRHFLALAQAGTFLGAAKRIGVEHATISRRIASFEQSLGRKLIDRRGRRIILTAEGEKVAQHAVLVAEQMAIIGQLGRNSASDMQGHVRISAPPGLSSARLTKPVIAVRKQYPGIEITLVGEKRLASLNRREADIAIRLSRPEDGDYVITKLGDIGFRLYASTAYLRNTVPAEWTFIGYDETMNGSPQQMRLLELAAGRPIAIRSSVLEFQVAAARLHGGIVMLPDFVVTGVDDLQPLDDYPPMTREIWLVVHSQVKDMPSVRAVMAALKSEFAHS